MFSKNSFKWIAAIAAGALVFSNFAKADTISVHSIGTPFTVVAGPFAGDEDYTYDIGFDNQADVIAPSDGFMVVDFGSVAGSTLVAATSGNATETTLAGEFTESTQLTGANLGGYTGNTLNTDHFSDPTSGNTSNPTDLTNVENAVFFYNGSSPFVSGPVDLTLDLFSTSTAPPKVGNGFGVDTSGVNNGLSFSLNTVLVPSAPASVPLPAAPLACGALFGMLGLAKVRKAVRVA